MQSFTFHCGPGGNRTGIGDYFRKVAGAGLAPRVFSVDDYGVCAEALAIGDERGVEAVTAWRPGVPEPDGFNWAVPGYNYTQATHTAASEYAARLRDKLPPEFDKRTWIIIWNEIDKHRLEYCAEIAMQLTNMLPEYKLAFFSTNSGEPEPEGWTGSMMELLLRKCEREPLRIGICLHEYSFATSLQINEGWHIGRLQFLEAACIGFGIKPERITVFINEFGYGKDDTLWPGTETAINELDNFAWPLYRDSRLRVLLVAWWTVHGGVAWGSLPDLVNELIVPQGDLTVMTNASEKVIPPLGPVEPPEPTPIELNNPSFEDGWTDHPQHAARIQIPNGWSMTVSAVDSVSPYFNSKENRYPLITGIPEITLKSRDFLPEDDWDLILDGEWTLKAIQAVNMVAAVRYGQLVTGLEPNQAVMVTVPVQVHYQSPLGDDSPDDTQIHITVGLKTVIFNAYPNLPDRTWVSLVAEGTTNDNGELFVGIGIGTVWQNSRDVFIDDITIEIVSSPTPPDQFKVIVLKTPQPHEYTLDEYHDLASYAFDKGRTWTASTDDLLRLMHNPQAKPESYVEVYRPELPSQQEAIAKLELAGFNWEEIGNDDSPFDYTHWPTRYLVVTQRFGARPDIYAKYKCDGVPLPGHEGIDIKALHGSPIYAPASGIVTKIHPDESDGHNYGRFLRIDHGDGYETTLAHLDSLLVEVGQVVVGGQEVGKADNTGNSTGSHLHLTLKRHGYTYEGWPCSIHNPEPFLEKFAPTWPTPPAPTGIDMAPYFLPDGDAGDLMILKNNWGAGDERVQLQRVGLISFVVKNQQYEQRVVGSDVIDFILDTSPGNNQFYTIESGTGWMPRAWNAGDRFLRNETVTYYEKPTCVAQTTTHWSSELVFAVLYDTWTSQGGIVLENVIELYWDLGGVIEERYWYAPGLGLVAWENRVGRKSWINELIPRGSQEDNVRESGCWL